MSWRQRLSMLGVGKSQDEVAAEEERYIADKKWIEVRSDRMDLKQQLWRKRHEHGAERWEARSELLKKVLLGWTEAFTRQQMMNLGGLMFSFLVFAFAVSLLAFPLRWAWDYVTAPSPEKPPGLENPAPRWFYTGFVSNNTQPVYKFYTVMDSTWGADPTLSEPYVTHAQAMDRLLELKPVWPNAYIAETSDSCWQVFEPSAWEKDKPVSACYPYFEQAETKRVELEDQIRAERGLPARGQRPADPQSPAPETQSPQTPLPDPSLGVSPIGPEAVAPDEAPPSSPSPAPDPEAVHPE